MAKKGFNGFAAFQSLAFMKRVFYHDAYPVIRHCPVWPSGLPVYPVVLVDEILQRHGH